MSSKKLFLRGIKDGFPICLGYLSVSFAFGIFAVGAGLSVWQTVLVSLANVTSAGQLAGVPIIVGSLPLIEMVLTQFVINLRYSLMSVSLSQKLSPRVKLLHRLAIAFGVTDEIFAVAISQKEDVETPYMLGLITSPVLGWVTGTALGALAGDILPEMVVSALGIALYAMFVAIVIPPSKKNHSVALCCLLAVALSCAFRYLPVLKKVSAGIAIIICALVSGLLFAWLAPIPDEEKKDPSDNETDGIGKAVAT
ncbi:MAG: AzlC family ABC transporter permease [Clostridiales bacterium]|nr:AzlC family ABC transporter permease [Clostridiales bacterium]